MSDFAYRGEKEITAPQFSPLSKWGLGGIFVIAIASPACRDEAIFLE
jgi:hypothetical protein